MNINKPVRHTDAKEQQTICADQPSPMSDQDKQSPEKINRPGKINRPEKINQNGNNNSAINDSAVSYKVKVGSSEPSSESDSSYANGLSEIQQQFVLKFCRQLASVIEACEQSESAEIEVGRRQIKASQITVKLQAEREFTHL